MKNIFKSFLDKLGQVYRRLFQYQKRDSFFDIKEITPFNPASWQESREAPFPRVYYVPKLILSVIYEQPSKYICTDMSKYEAEGIAHYFVTRTEKSEEVIADYNEKRGYEALAEEEEEMTTSYLEDVLLVEFDNGLWEWYD